jgi:hypothetical protein
MLLEDWPSFTAISKVEPPATLRANVPPLPHQQRAARQVGPDVKPVERHSFRLGRARINDAASE